MNEEPTLAKDLAGLPFQTGLPRGRLELPLMLEQQAEAGAAAAMEAANIVKGPPTPLEQDIMKLFKLNSELTEEVKVMRGRISALEPKELPIMAESPPAVKIEPPAPAPTPEPEVPKPPTVQQGNPVAVWADGPHKGKFWRVTSGESKDDFIKRSGLAPDSADFAFWMKEQMPHDKKENSTNYSHSSWN